MDWFQTAVTVAISLFSGIGGIVYGAKHARAEEVTAKAAARSAETAAKQAAAAVEAVRLDGWNKFSQALENRLSKTELRLDDCEKQHAECEERHQTVIREFEEIKGTVKQIIKEGT